jgi:hypothetical protein
MFKPPVILKRRTTNYPPLSGMFCVIMWFHVYAILLLNFIVSHHSSLPSDVCKYVDDAGGGSNVCNLGAY